MHALYREQAEALESGAETVNNLVHSFRLTNTQFDKKSFLTYLKVNSSALRQKRPDTRSRAT